MAPARKITRDRPGRRGLRIAVRVIVPVVFALGMWYLFTHVLRFGDVPSGSMEPTLQPDDWYILRLDAYHRHRPQHGDIIVFTDADGEPYVKRVIAVPGDHFAIIDGVVWLNRRPLNEPYIKERQLPERPIGADVPADSYFVLGDNRNESADSRDMGFVQAARIMGKATRIVWPLSRARALALPPAPALPATG